MSTVLFIDDVARELGTSRRTIERRLRARCFPIPEMPSLDNKHRWSSDAVEAFKARTKAEHVRRPWGVVSGGRKR